MLDAEGYVSEASGENIFMVRDRKIKTTPLTSILPGHYPGFDYHRSPVTKVTKLIEERFTSDELYTADEAFFTGTAAELTPIREVDDRQIGAGRRGPVTEDIQNAFFDVIKGKNGKYENGSPTFSGAGRVACLGFVAHSLKSLSDDGLSRCHLAGDHAAARYQCARHYLRRRDPEPYRLGWRHRGVAAGRA